MLAIVTGVGARGQVGEAVAAAFAHRGDTTVLIARDAAVHERASELRELGLDAVGHACDLADEAAVAELARRVRADHGEQLDALVNLAGGFGASGPIADSEPASFERLMRINLWTAYLTTRAFFPALRAASGSVVYFASESVLEGARTAKTAAYTAAKSAVVGLMRSVADEGRDVGVRANALAPGAIRTATNEASMGTDTRYVERAEVASAVLFLCSPAAAAITGQVIRLRA